MGYGLSTLTAGATSLSNKFSSANRHPSFIIANRRPHLLRISSSSPTPETVLERHRPAKHGHNNNKGTTAHPFRFLESTDPQRRALSFPKYLPPLSIIILTTLPPLAAHAHAPIVSCLSCLLLSLPPAILAHRHRQDQSILLRIFPSIVLDHRNSSIQLFPLRILIQLLSRTWLCPIPYDTTSSSHHRHVYLVHQQLATRSAQVRPR